MDYLKYEEGTFEFAFNNPRFSNSVLQIEVTTGELDDVTDQEEKMQVLRVERFHVSSMILASKSTFFRELFSNPETEAKLPATIRISASKYEAFVELLYFMYGRKLSSATKENSVALLDLVTLSHKYEVSSCIDPCIQLLSNMPMTQESASLCLDMASNVSVTSDIQSLVVAANKFLNTRYKDVTTHQEELCRLSSAAIESIFISDEIQVPSEDSVYDIIMKWAQTQFPKVEERRVILGSCITRIVRFPYMSYEKLKGILTRDDLDPEFAKDVFNEALFFKAEPLSQRWAVTESSKDRRFVKRDYTKCFYNFDLSLDQCKKLKEVGKLDSGRFYLGKQSFCLQCLYSSSKSSFGVYLRRPDDSSQSEITVRVGFFAMKIVEMDFVKINSYEHKVKRYWGYEDLFDMKWESFIGDDSPYFIDDMLHLKAEVTMLGN